IYVSTPALWERDSDPQGFTWIDADDSDRNVIAFLRWDSQGEPIAVVINMAGIPHEHYRLGLPSGGAWEEMLNTDADHYGGSGVGNLGEVQASTTKHREWKFSADVRVPPLGAVI